MQALFLVTSHGTTSFVVRYVTEGIISIVGICNDVFDERVFLEDFFFQ